MVVHLFGAVSSPSCANSAVRQTAKDHAPLFGTGVANTVFRNFYVDDCLTSVETEQKASQLIKDTTDICAKGGFKLTKWISNNPKVIKEVQTSERAKEVKDLDLDHDSLPTERALGVSWCLENDTLGFKVKAHMCSPTRRHILSVVSSIYDPLGLASPFVLTARLILRDMCRQPIGWDEEPLPDNLKKWNRWQTDLPLLENFQIERCYKPVNLGHVISCQIHHFSDASDEGYGVASYLRQVDSFGNIHCSLIMAKSRVAPLKTVTIPRMELTAATLSVRLNVLITKELDLPIDKTFYWTDSMSVIHYIVNKTNRFHTFVANRIPLIREASDPEQWRYINSKDNPADIASRGVSIVKFLQDETWLKGPPFLWTEESNWTQIPEELQLLPNDPEVKKTAVATVSNPSSQTMDRLLAYHSSWLKLKITVGWMLVAMDNLKRRIQQRKDLAQDHPIIHHSEAEGEKVCPTSQGVKEFLPPSILHRAENAIIRYIQRQHFEVELNSLISSSQTDTTATVKKSSPVYKLDPFVKDGIMRVGGRLAKSSIAYNTKYPILLPKLSPGLQLILQDIHLVSGHLGKNSMLVLAREKFWILGVNTLIKTPVSKCAVCRKYQARRLQQKMADLPADRLTPEEPPFSRVGVDYFGPFLVKQGRSQVKRYGVVFTCLAIRAVHLEIAHSLDTDSCINAFRRFLARRGPVKVMCSDNGTNLVGAEKELRMGIHKWNQSKIGKFLTRKGIRWVFNPPAGSHFGGAWERFRLVRKVLYSLLHQQSIKMGDEGLHTLICEVEAILNSRPITLLSNSPNDIDALTPNHLLTQKPGENLPPGTFSERDNFVRRKWRQIQYLADVFWKRWLKEYIPLLQKRQKWNSTSRNVTVGDVVLVVDETSRCSWTLGKVIQVFPDKKGLVRSVELKTKNGSLRRPIDKLCLVLEADTIR